MKREEIDKRWENLWMPAIVHWSYHVNRFELGSRSDPVSWLDKPYRCVVIGCLLIDLVMLIDSYRSMIVRFTSPATRGFLLPLLSLVSSLCGERKPLGPGYSHVCRIMEWMMNEAEMFFKTVFCPMNVHTIITLPSASPKMIDCCSGGQMRQVTALWQENKNKQTKPKTILVLIMTIIALYW